MYSETPTRAELEAKVGTADFNYHRRIETVMMTAYFGVPVLFVILCFVLG